jgi:hypothetical protein
MKRKENLLDNSQVCESVRIGRRLVTRKGDSNPNMALHCSDSRSERLYYTHQYLVA